MGATVFAVVFWYAETTGGVSLNAPPLAVTAFLLVALLGGGISIIYGAALALKEESPRRGFPPRPRKEVFIPISDVEIRLIFALLGTGLAARLVASWFFLTGPEWYVWHVWGFVGGVWIGVFLFERRKGVRVWVRLVRGERRRKVTGIVIRRQ